MKRRIVVGVLTAIAILAMAVPAASAQGAWRDDPWCVGVVLKPGQSCTSWPLLVNSFYTSWSVETVGRGQVCVALTQYGGSRHGQPLNGVPGYGCTPVPTDWHEVKGSFWPPYPQTLNPYRYGQARILNYSSARVKVAPVPPLNWVRHWAP